MNVFVSVFIVYQRSTFLFNTPKPVIEYIYERFTKRKKAIKNIAMQDEKAN